MYGADCYRTGPLGLPCCRHSVLSEFVSRQQSLHQPAALPRLEHAAGHHDCDPGAVRKHQGTENISEEAVKKTWNPGKCVNIIILQETPSADSPFICQDGEPACLANMIQVIAICNFETMRKTRCMWTDLFRPAGLHRPSEWPLGPADHLLHGVSC